MFSHAVDVMVLEYGIDHVGEMQQMLSVATPHVGVITCIDAVHSEQMGDPTHIAEQKRQMIDAATDVVFLNRDDVYVQQMGDRTVADVLWYSILDGDAGDVGYRSYTMCEDEELFLASDVELFVGEELWKGRINLLSKELISYAAIGMSIASVVGYRRETAIIDHDVMVYDLQPGRLSFFRGVGDSLIIDSSYNASPASMRAMLGLAHRVKHDVYTDSRPLIGIIGDMRELGELSEQAHR